MNLEDIREYCIKKPGVSEEFPFDEVTLVFKVMGKVFLLTGLDAPEPSLNLKCEPEYAIELREKYVGVKPGYHMNKKHWNTVSLDNDVPEKLIYSLIDHSYQQVVAGLSKKQIQELEQFE
jgi:predicted DNA-binding protein (MmcQ/YjbR family)